MEDEVGFFESTTHGYGLGYKPGSKGAVAGQVILSETPSLEMRAWKENDDKASDIVDDFLGSVRQLGRIEMSLFLVLVAQHHSLIHSNPKGVRDFLFHQQPSAEIPTALVDTFYRYSYPFLPIKASRFRWLGFISVLNHSCTPNATLYWDEDLRQMRMGARRPIEPLEEITISYVDEFQPRHKLHADLDFTCACEVCKDLNERFFSQRVKELRKMDAFRRQLLDDVVVDDMQIATRQQEEVLARESDKQSMLAVADSFILAVEEEFPGQRWASPKVADTYQLLYILRMVEAIHTRDETIRDRALDFAFVAKIRQLDTLWICFGPGDRRTKAVAAQLFKLANGVEPRLRVLKQCVQGLGSKFTLQMSDDDEKKFGIAVANI